MAIGSSRHLEVLINIDVPNQNTLRNNYEWVHMLIDLQVAHVFCMANANTISYTSLRFNYIRRAISLKHYSVFISKIQKTSS